MIFNSCSAAVSVTLIRSPPKRFPMESADIRTLVYSLVSSWLLILGLLMVVGSLRIVFPVLSHGIYLSTFISVNPVISWVSLLLLLVWTPLAYDKGLGRRILLLSLPLASYPLIGRVALGLAALTGFILVAQRKDVNRFVVACLLASVGVYMGLTLLYWLALYPLGWGAALEDLAVFEGKVYYLLALLAPWLYISLFTAFIVRGAQQLWSPTADVEPSSSGQNLRWLSALCLLSSVLVIYTMLPGVSPGGIEAGIDFQGYVNQLQTVEADPMTFLTVMHGERPFLFLLLYFSQRLLNLSAVETLMYAPIVLNPLLVLSIYLFTRQVLHDWDKALWASFFTVFGSTFSVGYFSYFLSNILGLSLILASLTLFFRAMETYDWASLLGATLFGGLTLFTHPWTFVHYVIPLIATLTWLGVEDLRTGSVTRNAGYLVICVVVVAALELFKSSFLGLYGGVDAFRGFNSGLTSPAIYVTHLLDGTRIRFGGFLANPTIIVLAFVGFSCLKYRNEPELYLILLYMSTGVGFILGGEVVKSRFIFNAPLYIVAGLGLERFLEWNYDRRLTISTMVLYLGVILFRSMANVF